MENPEPNYAIGDLFNELVDKNDFELEDTVIYNDIGTAQWWYNKYPRFPEYYYQIFEEITEPKKILDDIINEPTNISGQ